MSDASVDIQNGTDGQQTNKTPLQSTTGEMSRPNNLQRIAQKKAMVRSYPRNKKLEKLAVYSSCKVLFTSSSTVFNCIYTLDTILHRFHYN